MAHFGGWLRLLSVSGVQQKYNDVHHFAPLTKLQGLLSLQRPRRSVFCSYAVKTHQLVSMGRIDKKDGEICGHVVLYVDDCFVYIRRLLPFIMVRTVCSFPSDYILFCAFHFRIHFPSIFK